MWPRMVNIIVIFMFLSSFFIRNNVRWTFISIHCPCGIPCFHKVLSGQDRVNKEMLINCSILKSACITLPQKSRMTQLAIRYDSPQSIHGWVVLGVSIIHNQGVWTGWNYQTSVFHWILSLFEMTDGRRNFSTNKNTVTFLCWSIILESRGQIVLLVHPV